MHRAARDDDFGLFWERFPTVKRHNGPHVLPPTPNTGWLLPNEYPDLSGQGMISVDIEGYDPDLKTKGPGALRDGRMVGVAIGTQAGFRKYYPFGHEIGPNLEKEPVIAWLKRELKRPVPKIGTNILFDLMYLSVEGVEVTGPFYDVQIAEPLLDENRLSYSLENLARIHLGEGKIEGAMRNWLMNAYGEKNYKSNIWRAPTVVVGPYAEGDVDLPQRIFELQKTELEKRGLWDLFIMESKLIPVLLKMWRRGVPVDVAQAEALHERLGVRQSEIIVDIKRTTGIEPNIWAADSLAQVFDKIEVPYLKTDHPTKPKPSFRKGWLEKCGHPVAQQIVEARNLDKLRGTFLQGYILEGHINGVVHGLFHQLRSDEGGTVSGRFSSSKPNLQNIPKHGEVCKLLRDIFIAEAGLRWWKFDWSQIEFRLAIHHACRLKFKGAQAVIDQYWNNPKTDYHTVCGSIVGLPRSAAKHINFGIIYGMGIAELAKRLGVSLEVATRMYREYMSKLPFIGKLRDAAMDHCAKYGVIQTLSGRQRHFDMWERDGIIFPQHVKGSRRAFTHAALNARLQGDAADIMKKAMVQADEAGIFDVLGLHLTVHDELDGSYDEGSNIHIEALAELKHIMQTCETLLLPLVADGGTGPNWGSIE